MTPALLATEPGGRIAVAGALAGGGGGWAVYDAPTGGLVASAAFTGRPTGIRFHGPSRLIVTSALRDAGYVRAWYLDGTQAQFVAFASVRGARNPVVIPGRDQIGVLAARWTRVRVFDGVTLSRAKAPAGFPSQAVRRQWNSADGRIWVLAGPTFATVFPGRHSVLTIADRPPAEWGPADLGTVTEALGSPDIDAAARPLLDLLRARLACCAVLPGKPPPRTARDLPHHLQHQPGQAHRRDPLHPALRDITVPDRRSRGREAGESEKPYGVGKPVTGLRHFFPWFPAFGLTGHGSLPSRTEVRWALVPGPRRRT
jgi:hypothetical protein